MKGRFLLAILAYILPTFLLGYAWHLVMFKGHYAALAIYRDEVIIPFGLASMAIQAVVWAYIYSCLFTGQGVVRGAVKFAALAAPLAWSFLVLVVAAKHPMTSVPAFVALETAFTGLQYLVVSPLIALAFSGRRI